MNTGSITEEEMQYLIDKYQGDEIDKLFSTGLLSHPGNAAGPRQHMFSLHYGQRICPDNPESPRVFTGYERTFGKYLNSFIKADKNYEIIAKIARHSSFPLMSYLLVLKVVGKNEYDVVKVNHYEKLSDNHGYMRPFTYMDDKNVGSRITKDDMIVSTNSLDEFGNYRYGVNAKVAFLLSPEVKDDAIIVSKSFAEKNTFTLITKTEAIINKNDILINLFGDLNHYKCLMNVGETIPDDSILMAIRKMDKKNISADFTDNALSHLYYTDNKFNGSGTVVDIDIKVNDVEELQSDAHRDQLFQIYSDQMRYNQEIYNVLNPIVQNKMNTVSHRLEQELFNATNYISPNVKYSCNTGNFEFAHITIYTAYKTPLITAMKLTNRCGAKAVISNIWPDENMPVNEQGVRADIVCCSNGVVGRANPDQNIEQNITYVSDEIIRRAQKAKSVDESLGIIIDYLLIISPEWGKYFKECVSMMTIKQKSEFLDNIYVKKLSIYNPPKNKSVTFQKLKEINNKYKIKVSKIKMCREYKVSEEIADLYDSKENIDAVKSIMENYTFDTKKSIEGKGKNKKEIYEPKEFSILDVNHNVKNGAKLKLDEYKENQWTDNYTWDNDNEIGIEQLSDKKNNESMTELNDYITNTQELEKVIEDDEDFIKVLENGHSEKTFDTTKSRVFRKNKNTLVREFTSKYPVMISDVYFMILKHIPSNNFSARSLGSITPLGLPNKSVKKSEVGKPYSDSCVQISEMENSDLKNLCDPKKVARFFAVQATHPTLRSEMAGMLLTQDPRHLHDLPYTDDEIRDTIPAKMKDAYLSAIGLEILDKDEKDPYEFADNLKYTTFAELMKKAGVIPENSPLLNTSNQ